MQPLQRKLDLRSDEVIEVVYVDAAEDDQADLPMAAQLAGNDQRTGDHREVAGFQ